MSSSLVEKAKVGLYEMNKPGFLEEAFKELLSRKINTSQDLVMWLEERDEVTRHIREVMDRDYINFNSYNDNEEYKKRFQYDQEILSPIIEKYDNLLDKMFYNNEFRDSIGEYYELMIKRTKNSIELFREENIDLGVEESKYTTKYFDITGNMTVMWQGEEKTLPEMSVYLKDSHRGIREEAWKAINDRRLKDVDALDDIMDNLISIRHKIAENAGCKDYVEYKFKELERFDYTPEDCVTFHESVKKCVVPLWEKIQEKHKKDLGVDSYKPWDTLAVLKGQKPLRPYETTEELIEGVLNMLKNTDEYFYNVLKSMKDGKTLDLKSRKAKSPGGFCTYLPITELPFIFMNEANSHGDLTTLVHESGHSVHDMLCKSQKALNYTNNPSEIAEVASMGMELLSMDKWQEFYKNQEELKRAEINHLEDILKTVIWVMVVDKFQHWLYSNPTATSEMRNDKFAEIASEFSEAFVDWSGYEEELKHMWKKQLHIYEVPFYYIEYAIAQLGAVQLWRNYKKDPKMAIEKYKEALSLGSSKSLPQLYKAMGIEFDFSENIIKELMDFVCSELEKLN